MPRGTIVACGARADRLLPHVGRSPGGTCPQRLEPDRRFILSGRAISFFHRRALGRYIISAGYNIAGPEQEAALLSHAHAAECAATTASRTRAALIVEAHVVLVEGVAADDLTRKILQDHAAATIAPYNIRARRNSPTRCRRRRPARSSGSG